jgi:hypothetical protein
MYKHNYTENWRLEIFRAVNTNMEFLGLTLQLGFCFALKIKTVKEHC